MACPFCCLLESYRGFVNIGFIVNCCLDNATPPINHVYGAGFVRKSSFYGDNIRLYSSPTDGEVIFTGRCDDIFELHFPQFGVNNTLNLDELKAMAEQQKVNLFESSNVQEEKSNG